MSEVDADRYSIQTTVAGVSYRQDAVSRCHEGQTVQLFRNPSNTHDRNAIEVHAGEQIGFIPRDETEILALYMDFYGQDSVEATIDRLTGGTEDKPTIGVVVDIQVSEVLYNSIDDDPDFIRESITRNRRMAEIEASLTDDDVRRHIQGIDDRVLDARYGVEQQNKWEKEQKEKVKRRLGRELESYEEDEIEEKAETRFLQYREKYEVTSRDRERLRNSMAREDVVHSILIDEDLNKIEEDVKTEVRMEQTEENRKVIVGLAIVAICIVIAVAIAIE